MYGWRLLWAPPPPVDDVVKFHPVRVSYLPWAPSFHPPALAPFATARVWVCHGISGVVSTWVFSPHVSPSTSNSICDVSRHTGIRHLKFGRLKVVEPSPTPYVVPITQKRLAYVVRDMADQSEINHHVGAVFVDHILISHVIPGNTHEAVVPSVVRFFHAFHVCSGIGNCHDTTVPFVLRDLPAWPLWLGRAPVSATVKSI